MKAQSNVQIVKLSDGREVCLSYGVIVAAFIPFTRTAGNGERARGYVRTKDRYSGACRRSDGAMNPLKIIVEGSHPGRSDAFWTEIEKAIGALTGESTGRLTRIRRTDGGCNYRAHGQYDLTFTAAWSEHAITLELR